MSKNNGSSRRRFLQGVAFGGVAAAWLPSAIWAKGYRSPNERPVFATIGLRNQGWHITSQSFAYADFAALADVDSNVLAANVEKVEKAQNRKPDAYGDYRKILERKDIDAVMIATPDHWHTKIAVEAMLAGKDVYCEKPLTLTIDEGKLLTKVVKETGRVVQVGSWQRSDDRFRQAVEMVRGGRIGQLQQVDVVLGKNATSGSFVPRTPPAHLNWNLWQGQTPNVPYIEERSHYTFRWWYEYSGGQMTDWGAHHIDIAQWAIDSVPIEINGTAKMPTVANGYNVAIDFNVTYKYANGVMMTVGDTGDNGILFTGDAGRMFVNRGKITGAAVEALPTNPLNRADWKVYDYDNHERPARAGKLDAIINHMGNFFDCVESRRTPVSDVESQHRSVSTCHLGNISMRLGRPLKWNPESEMFPDDAEANAMLGREQRQGFETS